jgi:shikimate kinase
MSAEAVAAGARVLLVGLMASGKTTVGQAIAGASGWPYLDNDALLERSSGATAAQLLAEHGVEQLRAAESDVLTLLVSMPGPFVAGVAAGTVLDPRDRERIRSGGHVVWLKASVETLVRRVAKQGGRAWLDDDPKTVLRTMAQEREPLYADIAHQVLDMDRISPAQAAREVVAAVNRP